MTESTPLSESNNPILSENNAQTADNSLSILTFTCAGQRYGVSVMAVVQIIEMVTIIGLPYTPPAIKGIINVRGQIVPVLDLRQRFGCAAVPYQVHTPIILIEYRNRMLALVVDEMGEVLMLPADSLSGVDAILPADLLDASANGHRLSYLAGVGQIDRQMIPILHLPAILSDSEHQQLLSALARQEMSEVVSS